MKGRWSAAAALAVISLALVSCAGSRSAWTPLSPLGRPSAESVQKSEKTVRSVTVAAELLETKSRYLARIEVRNQGRAAVHGPEEIVLTDRGGRIQTALSVEEVKDETMLRAQATAESIRDWGRFGPTYYYVPRRVYYGRNQYRTVYMGPYSAFAGGYARRDWVEREIEAERVLERAEERVTVLDAEYARSQAIPAEAVSKGFVEFIKTTGADAPVGPVTLSLKVGNRNYRFEFAASPPS